jgi:ribose transport system permease protein
VSRRVVRTDDRRFRLSLSALRDYGIVVSVAVLFIVLSLASPAFLTTTNLLNILEQNASVGIIAFGATAILIAGGFDLSAGAVYALAGVVAALIARDVDPVLGLVAGLVLGVACGLFNGILVTGLLVNPFVATLASSLMFRGAAVLLTGGLLVIVNDSAFTAIGGNEVFDIKYSVFVFLAFFLILWGILSGTQFGRHISAVGGNADAARLAGIRVNVVRTAAFTISGFSAGLGGVLAASRISTGEANAGLGIEFTAIAAAIVGGTSIYGGEGALWRTMFGVFLLALIGNGFNLLNIDPFYQQITTGVILVVAVSLDAFARRTR